MARKPGAKAPRKSQTKARKSAPRASKPRASKPATSAPTTFDASDVANAPASIVDTMDEEELDRALAAGRHREELEEYFGPDLYRELSVLAGQAQSKRTGGGPAVAILPGIMGSELSTKHDNRTRLVWVNPLQLVFGGFRSLHTKSGDKTVFASNVLRRYYKKLKLVLESKGYDVRYIPFDWRLSLDHLGKELIAQIKAEKGKIHLVAHSMGGLVARAAAKIDRGAFDKVVQLGTPNFGSFSPVTAIRGTHSLAQKIEAFDITQNMAKYIDLFSSFPGLLQMIPSPERYGERDLFDIGTWPSGTQLTAAALADARKVQKNTLASGDKTFWLIAGIDQETINRVRMTETGGKEEFEFLTSTDGDGTVPLEFARLDGVKETYFVAEEHGALPNNTLVGAAVDEILRKGQTTILSNTRSVRGAPVERVISEQDLARAAGAETMRGRMPTAAEQRHLLDGFLSVATDGRAAVATAAKAPTPAADDGLAGLARSRSIVVGRRRQRGLEINLAFGSITEADARALVLGIFEKVTPSGAAAAVNEALGGAIQHYIDRRMFQAGLGETTIIPATRRRLGTEFVIFAGLGAFDQFTPTHLQSVGENLARMLVDTNVEDIAMVPFGGGTGIASGIILRNFLKGFFAGLADVDTRGCFRRLTICEIDPAKYEALISEILHLTTTELFEGVEATIDRIDLPEPRRSGGPARAAERQGAEPIYLIARRYSLNHPDSQDRGEIFEAAVLTGGATAAIVSDLREIDANVLEASLKTVDDGNFDKAGVETLGALIRDSILGEKVAAALTVDESRPLVIVHDAGASRIPWEALSLKRDQKDPRVPYPALLGGISRRYMSRDLSVAKWLNSRALDSLLDVLLVVNPTMDLDGADKEGEAVRKILLTVPNARVTVLRHRQATRAKLIEELQSGKFDVLHYAGHAFFDPLARERSGILCHGDEVLSGLDLAGLSSLPALVVCNACQSARVRMQAPAAGRRTVSLKRIKGGHKPPAKEELARNVSFAEAFLRGGIANYIGTHWPVGDDPAAVFAETLYTKLAGHTLMQEAVTEARRAVESKGSKDWADYIHYGDPDFQLKAKQEAAS